MARDGMTTDARTRRSAIWIGLAAVLALGLATAYFLSVRAANTEAVSAAPTLASADPAAILAAPHIVFRNSALGADYGVLAAVSAADPGGPRAVLGISCERAYAVADGGVCLTAKRGVVQKYGISTLDAQLKPLRSATLAGLPSRARMSTDGSLVSTTTFVTGHSYAQAAFSTETVVRRGGEVLGNVETWKATVDGRPLTAVDRNFWGVTFASDNDTFYVTAASGATTWLMRGSLRTKTMSSLRTDAECPSLSPDGTKVAYKKRLGSAKPGVWRLAVLDLNTGQETLLAETRSVDDQVEWLDDGALLYALSRAGSEATTADVWVVPADGSGGPRVLISQASSPAVVRG